MENLLWFYKNLEQQVEDIKYKRDKKQIVLFFDTADIKGTIIGFPELYNDHKTFVKKRFDEKRTLVRSLIASGCLQKVQMLPPHQLEFIDGLERRLPLNDAQWSEDFQKFFYDFNEHLGNFLNPNIPIEKQLDEALLKKPDLADAWFKFLQNIEPWHSRYQALMRLDALYLDKEKKEWMTEIVIMPELENLKKGFEREERRAHLHYNNLTDAIALVYLIKMIDLFNNGKSNVVPRFFDPMPTSNRDESASAFQKAIRFAKLEDRFCCQPISNSLVSKTSSIFRNEDYFIFKVALRNPFAAEKNTTDSPQSEEKADMELLDLYEKISARINEGKSPDEFSDIKYQDKPLDDFIENLQKFAFLKNDWLKLKAQKELASKLETVLKRFDKNEKLQDLFENFNRFYQSEEVQNRVRSEISKTKEHLQERVYKDLDVVLRVRNLWNSLEQAIKNLKDRIHPDDAGYYNTFRDLGLLRYGFPFSSHDRIKEILDEMYSGDETRIRNSRAETINAYLKAYEDNGNNSEQMVLATAVFLALRMNDDLFKLLSNKERNLTHFSLKAAYAEMLFRLGKEKYTAKGLQMWDKGKKIISELIDYASRQSLSAQEKADVNVAIAYLSYHAWRFQVDDAMWREISINKDLKSHYEKYQPDIFNAIKYAEKAYEQFDEDSNLQRKIYALNQFIFYSVEGGDEQKFEEVKQSARVLANNKQKPLIWQFRYDDTLARYFHRLSLTAKNSQDKRKYADSAMERIKDALRRSDGDRDVEHYHAVLTTYEPSIE